MELDVYKTSYTHFKVNMYLEWLNIDINSLWNNIIEGRI